MKRKVLTTTSTFGKLDNAPIKKLEEHGFEVTLNPFKRKLTKEESMQLLPGNIGVIAGLETLDYEVLSHSDLKVISRCGSGVSNVNFEAAVKLGIEVCNTPDGPTNAVAELTLAAMLCLLRMVNQMDVDLHKGEWTKKIGFELAFKTILIIGFGRIGRKVSELLKPFNVKILVVDPFYKNDVDGVNSMKLEDALSLADIVSFHCSGEECIISEPEIKLMKKGVFLLNAARGGLVDESALKKALDASIVSGAWLDTFEEEPYSGDLLKYPQVILTPHVGSYTRECRVNMEMQAVENLIRVLKN